MSTQRPDESAQTRLLALAEDEIRRRGFRRMRVVDVAAAAGMTHANVYRYFPSRIALADAVTVGWLKPVEAMLRDAATAPDPATDKLERMALALARAYRDRLEREPDLFALFADAVETGRPVARKHRSRVRGEFGRVVEEALGEHAEAGEDRERLTTMLLDAVHRFLHPPCLVEDKEMARAAFDSRLSHVLEGALTLVRRRLRADGDWRRAMTDNKF